MREVRGGGGKSRSIVSPITHKFKPIKSFSLVNLKKKKKLLTCHVTIQGIFCSGLAYYIQGVIMKDRGPVFVTAFNPLSMVIVAVLSTIILREQLNLGR